MAPKKKVEVEEVVETQVVKEFSFREKIRESSKEELLWLLSELQRLNVRSIGDLENLIAKV